MKRILVNFASSNFRLSQRISSASGRYIGGFDLVRSFSEHDIDGAFFRENRSILKEKRGAGYWLWKPYFLMKVIREASPGDLVFYADSGSIFLRPVQPIISHFLSSGDPVGAFELPLIECQWTKPGVFSRLSFEADRFAMTNQLMAGFILVRVGLEAESFISKWLELCIRPEYLVDDQDCAEGLIDSVSPGIRFIAHRHDQSLFSLLYKSFGYTPLQDATQFGETPYLYGDGRPFAALRSGKLAQLPNGRLFRLSRRDADYVTTILLHRGSNPLKIWLQWKFLKFRHRHVFSAK